jgi:hypothetical protein
MDATVTDPDADTPDASAPETGTEGRGLKRFLIPGLIAGLVLAVAVAGIFGILWFQTSDTDSQEVGAFLADQKPDAEKTATEVITLLTNYDAANIDAVVGRMLNITTGSFRKDYNDTFEAGLSNAIKNVSTSARGQILSGPDISFRGPDEAVAVARVTQTIQNKENPGGRTFVDVMQITLIHTADGGWKADRVEILGGQET